MRFAEFSIIISVTILAANLIFLMIASSRWFGSAEICSELMLNASPAFAPVSRCVASEQEKRVRIPLNGLERLCGGVCEKWGTPFGNHPGGRAARICNQRKSWWLRETSISPSAFQSDDGRDWRNAQSSPHLLQPSSSDGGCCCREQATQWLGRNKQ
jgi:hypothetical protein